MGPDDVQMISTGVLRLPDGAEYDVGETVYVEGFELRLSAEAEARLGITPDMNEHDVALLLKRLMDRRS